MNSCKMIKRLFGSVTIPPRPRSGMDALTFAQAVWKALDQIRGMTYDSGTAGNDQPQKPNPFDCNLTKKDGEYFVTVEDGVITERKLGTEDAVKIHEITNIKLGEESFPPNTAGNRKPFPVKAGEQVTLLVEVSNDGSILNEPKVVIEKIGEESVHFAPIAGDDLEGVFGEYRYKLATIETSSQPEGGLILKQVMAGSHVDHWVDIPRLANAIETEDANVGRIVKEYDKAGGKFVLRAIKSVHPDITITETDETVEIGQSYNPDDPGGDAGKNLNLIINYLNVDNNGAVYDIGPSPTTIYFRNGLYVGNEDPDNGNPPAQLDTQNATYLNMAP